MQKTILNEYKIKTEQEYFELIIRKSVVDPPVGIDLFLALNKSDRKAALGYFATKLYGTPDLITLNVIIICVNSL